MKKEFKDPELTERFNNRDGEAIAFIHELLYKKLCKFVDQIVDDQWEAEDVVSGIFINTLKVKTRFDNLAHITNYLFKAAANKSYDSINSVRRKKAIYAAVQDEVEISDEPILQKLIRAEVFNEVHKAMQRLSTEQRQVLELSFFGQMDPAEIAAKLGIEVQSARNKKNRALEALRHKIKKNILILLLLVHFSPN